ncbi:hypothetical protein PoB_000375200 [Plakobranchus ocellatus]|uniref:Uncharacterized protein n=1 Tax=Plakobranchus ocellatus TaxID=259542 RepID=A0AAV3Y464_9GAST|nr:hypothetical protein PoB_000375200 [Plakobranchus ocellatus]
MRGRLLEERTKPYPSRRLRHRISLIRGYFRKYQRKTGGVSNVLLVQAMPMAPDSLQEHTSESGCVMSIPTLASIYQQPFPRLQRVAAEELVLPRSSFSTGGPYY